MYIMKLWFIFLLLYYIFFIKILLYLYSFNYDLTWFNFKIIDKYILNLFSNVTYPFFIVMQM